MYRYSMTQWIVGNENIEYSFGRLKRFGYDGIELAAEANTVDQARIVKLMKTYEICCTSLCGIFPNGAGRDLCAAAGEDAQNAVRYVCDNVDYAEKVGAGLMIIVPSPVGCTALPAGCSYEEQWSNAVRNIRIAGDYAKEHGVMLAVEAINRYETYLVNTLPKAYRLVKEIDHPSVGIMADMFHMSMEENNIPSSLHLIADKLIHVHLADNTREAAGLGRTDFKEMLYALKDVNYQGCLTMEFMPRLANPYASVDMKTKSEQIDFYAEHAINYMKLLERCVAADS